MASKRVALSAVNWAAINQRVPSKQREAFNILKNTSDKYVVRIQELPDSLPKINFAEYKAKLPGLSAFVSEFEKQYGAVQVPYPKDTSDVKGALQKEEVMVREKSANFIQRETHYLNSLQTMLKKIESIPPPEKMTMQMFNYYFPENAINPNRENPGFWYQLDDNNQIHNMRKLGKNFAWMSNPQWRVNLDDIQEFEDEWLEKVIEWEKEEYYPKLKAILDGYEKIANEALDKHVSQMSEDARNAFLENEDKVIAFKQKCYKENGITQEKFTEDAVAAIGPVKDFESIKEYLDALKEV